METFDVLILFTHFIDVLTWAALSGLKSIDNMKAYIND